MKSTLPIVRVTRNRIVAAAVAFVVVMFGLAFLYVKSAPTFDLLAGGPRPAVGLYWYDNTDPTMAPGMVAPSDQLLVRTDAPSLYYKSGAATTAWTRIGAGTSSGGTVTSVACGTGLSCSPSSPITTSGTVNVSLTTTTCPGGQAEIATAANGTSTCAAFGSSSLTNSAGNNVVTKSNGTNLVASSISDDGTTVSTAENVNIGTSTSADPLDVRGATQVTLETTNTPTNKLTIHSSGNTVWDFDPLPGAATDIQSLRMFRHTVTSGNKDLCITPGNASTCSTDLFGTARGGATLSNFANGVGIVATHMIALSTDITINNGSVSTSSIASVGQLTAVGATTTTMTITTLTGMILNRAWCTATPVSASPQVSIITASLVATSCTGTCAVLFSCYAATTGIAANCPDFNYNCFYAN